MTRVKRGNSGRQRRRHKLRIVKGCRGASSLLFRTANQQFLKASYSAFGDRRFRKRYFRNVWIHRINAKVRQFGFNYNSFIHKINPKISRKILAQLALYDNLQYLEFINQ
uniref:50S ribosomal protein L20 n=1 Tax=Tydemania expeditionis TaxID=325645 RepID=A0A0D6E2V7_TYDEX|nr:50S ribosomal protein L20 [Tydemania expeditionis]CEO91107.1 50S ribosomal protein L20 [Tydemania expeditionis]